MFFPNEKRMTPTTAESSRVCLRDTSVNPKNPYHTRKYFEGRLFWSLFFFALVCFSFELLRCVSNESCGSLLEVWILLFPVWVKIWKSENWKFWSKYIIAKKPALANGL
jgi:hypothetical protein